MEQLNSKILLFGEYAVLHNGMALVVPFDKYKGHFDFYDNTAGGKTNTDAQSNEYLRKFCAFVSSRMDEDFVLEVKKFEKELEEGLFFKSNIPQGYGLGSSGALVAAIVLRYLVKAKNLKDEIKASAFQKLQFLKKNLGDLESFFHGTSSGLDPLSIILNVPILYKTPEDIIPTQLPTPSSDKENVAFLLDTKAPRTTSKMMKLFNDLNRQPEFHDKFKENVEQNNNRAIETFLAGNTSEFYDAVEDLSSFQLEYMKDFFPRKLQKDVANGLSTGDYYLKICGAGGGGYVLGFTSNWEDTQEQLKNYQLEEICNY